MSTLSQRSYSSGRPSSASLYGYSSRIGMSRAPSVYGGAGGQSVRVSYASGSRGGFDLSSAAGGNNAANEKATMQNLNDRLATYLDKVRSLETANAKLEFQIREWYERKSPIVNDYSKYQAIIADLRKKISVASLDNARILLMIDNAKLAAEDFKLKYENEMSMRMSVEADIAGLRKVLDELTMSRSDLEMQIEGLKEELLYLKKNHAEEMDSMRAALSSSTVNVEVDAAPQEDMARVMDEIRTQYEGIVDKNRREMEAWYKVKFDELNKVVTSNTQELQMAQQELSELKRTFQSLEIELQSQINLRSAMEGQLTETQNRYNRQLSQLQITVNSLETELGKMKMDIERQACEYKMLLDIKTRLEMEIAEYRRLLDGEDVSQCVVIKKVEVVKQAPVITKRVRTVVEEVVDGKVVSRTEDVDVAVVSK
ncbi:keratin, type I cytoskeletal 13-like [Osmerus eperlanus]|uniref:keratin, type I cytoskeletal 13-like n=1 Tax=Osmerus eperlanus TaxID=29151 RepID=UPI002E1416D1